MEAAMKVFKKYLDKRKTKKKLRNKKIKF